MRPDRNRHHYRPIHPDVLSVISTGPRVSLPPVEALIGIYPRMAYLNQPFEVVVILQSLIDQPLPLRISVQTPNTDADGDIIVIDTAKSSISFPLKAAEVGVLRIPMITRPPTKSARDLPMRVAIRYKEADHFKEVRPAGGGAPPSVLSVSEFKAQVLREIDFNHGHWDPETRVMTITFDLAPKTFPDEVKLPPPRYEALWTQAELEQDVKLATSKYDEAVELARPGPLNSLFYAFMEEIQERFAARGMPLHPAEAAAIAKMMTYAVEDAPARESIIMENTRWFRQLCQLLAAEPNLAEELPRHDIFARRILTDVLYDAILLAFNLLDYHVQEDLGSKEERLSYARRLITWFVGSGEADLTYVYLPLVLGGVSIGYAVARNWGDNPWYFYDQMLEAYNGRLRLEGGGADAVIFDMLDALLEGYARRLRQTRVPRPD